MRISEAMMIASAIETSDKKVWEAIVTLIEAAKKQEPVKPVPIKYEPLIRHGWEYGCPACEKAVGFNKYAVEYTDNDPFCPSCGRKLDWGDWSEE